MTAFAPFAPACLIAISLTIQTPSARATVTDPRDGKRYPVVEIAGATWMARNLDHAMSGTACPRGDADACEREGRLYPWPLAVKACPPGWHLSTEEEWQRLERALGMPAEEITRERARGTGQRVQLEVGGVTGLDFPLVGWRRPDGTFAIGNGNDRAAAIWTSTLAREDAAWHRDLSSARPGVWRSPVTFDYSLSVRCVQDR